MTLAVIRMGIGVKFALMSAMLLGSAMALNAVVTRGGKELAEQELGGVPAERVASYMDSIGNNRLVQWIVSSTGDRPNGSNKPVGSSLAEQSANESTSGALGNTDSTKVGQGEADAASSVLDASVGTKVTGAHGAPGKDGLGPKQIEQVGQGETDAASSVLDASAGTKVTGAHGAPGKDGLGPKQMEQVGSSVAEQSATLSTSGALGNTDSTKAPQLLQELLAAVLQYVNLNELKEDLRARVEQGAKARRDVLEEQNAREVERLREELAEGDEEGLARVEQSQRQVYDQQLVRYEALAAALEELEYAARLLLVAQRGD